MPYHTAATRMAVSQGGTAGNGVEHTNTAKGGDDFLPPVAKMPAGLRKQNYFSLHAHLLTGNVFTLVLLLKLIP